MKSLSQRCKFLKCKHLIERDDMYGTNGPYWMCNASLNMWGENSGFDGGVLMSTNCPHYKRQKLLLKLDQT